MQQQVQQPKRYSIVRVPKQFLRDARYPYRVLCSTGHQVRVVTGFRTKEDAEQQVKVWNGEVDTFQQIQSLLLACRPKRDGDSSRIEANSREVSESCGTCEWQGDLAE